MDTTQPRLRPMIRLPISKKYRATGRPTRTAPPRCAQFMKRLSQMKLPVNTRIAFEMGVAARAKGLPRISPFYEDERADKFWYGGYDGQSMEELPLIAESAPE